jgi:hypothetical protein
MCQHYIVKSGMVTRIRATTHGFYGHMEQKDDLNCPMSESESRYDRRSVGLSVLVSSPIRCS